MFKLKTNIIRSHTIILISIFSLSCITNAYPAEAKLADKLSPQLQISQEYFIEQLNNFNDLNKIAKILELNKTTSDFSNSDAWQQFAIMKFLIQDLSLFEAARIIDLKNNDARGDLVSAALPIVTAAIAFLNNFTSPDEYANLNRAIKHYAKNEFDQAEQLLIQNNNVDLSRAKFILDSQAASIFNSAEPLTAEQDQNLQLEIMLKIRRPQPYVKEFIEKYLQINDNIGSVANALQTTINSQEQAMNQTTTITGPQIETALHNGELYFVHAAADAHQVKQVLLNTSEYIHQADIIGYLLARYSLRQSITHGFHTALAQLRNKESKDNDAIILVGYDSEQQRQLIAAAQEQNIADKLVFINPNDIKAVDLIIQFGPQFIDISPTAPLLTNNSFLLQAI